MEAIVCIQIAPSRSGKNPRLKTNAALANQRHWVQACHRLAFRAKISNLQVSLWTSEGQGSRLDITACRFFVTSLVIESVCI
jgi:hypothetical protein